MVFTEVIFEKKMVKHKWGLFKNWMLGMKFVSACMDIWLIYVTSIILNIYFVCMFLLNIRVKLTQVKPRHPMASANISPNKEGNEFRAGKYACMYGLCQCVIYKEKRKNHFLKCFR